MFVIADITHIKVPSYLWKVLPNGVVLISVELSKIPQFATRKEAKEFLNTVKDHGSFKFQVCELGIINGPVA